ncbi:MAG: hypothetical protein OES47_06065 [Acidobacteriota bacterium]|nr:hypothetical protein [Acidobacteriota bacterium]
MRRSLLALPMLLAAAVLGPAFADTEISGQGAGGGYYKIVVPDNWNNKLVIWNHGFSLDPVGPVEDMGPLIDIQLAEGFAVAASSYRLAGWAVFDTSDDLEEMVDAFIADSGAPDEIYLYGASLGGLVTAAAIEQADLGNVVGAFPICGALAGSRNWDAGLDFRLIYDVYCGKGASKIAGGPFGLDPSTAPTVEEVAAAVNACTGVLQPEATRTKKQKKNLKKLLKVMQIPESFLTTDMGFSTFAMADLVSHPAKLGGKLAVGNENVDYGNKKVNRKIQRVKPKKKSAKQLRKNYTPNGNVGDVKIISMHTDKDGLVIVENESEYAEVVPADHLTTAIVVEAEATHCVGFTPAELTAGWIELQAWVNTGEQPDAERLQASCIALEPIAGGPCRIDPAFEIPDMDGRIRPR